MTSPGEDVYEAAARARMILWGYDKTLDPQDFEDAVRVDAEEPALRMLVDAGVAAGRAQAAADIRAAVLADVNAPRPTHNGYQHQGAEWAAKIAGGEPRG